VAASPRDFSTISPSAKSLLLVKSQTSLPFARQAAELLWGANVTTLQQQTTALAQLAKLGILSV